ncbi:MAG: ABC transporter permease [Oscillospiraceae bacterium]
MANEATKTTTNVADNHEEVAKKQSRMGEVMKRLFSNPVAIASLVVIVIMLVLSIFADYIAPYTAAEMTGDIFAKPFENGHIFGTDNIGRDLFSRVVHGAKTSIALGAGATAIALVFGLIIGSLSGYFGGVFDNAVMRILDVIQSIPGVLLNMVLCVVLGGGVLNTTIALGIAGIPSFIRIQRASVMGIRDQEYIDAADMSNCNLAKKIMSHVIPNSLSPVIVTSTMRIGGTIMAAAGLSFLGVGVPQEIPEWGALLSAGRDYIKNYPYLTICPGICLIVFVLAMNLFGDALRDALDPKLKK